MPEAIRRFVAILRNWNVSVTVRKTKGRAIDAACGQLRRRLDQTEGEPLATGNAASRLISASPRHRAATSLVRPELTVCGNKSSGLDFTWEAASVVAEADNLEQQLEARDPDVRLMIQVRTDVAGAFETLVERYQNRLMGILFHLVGNREEAEDLCQEVFLRIYRARKGYRPSCQVFHMAVHDRQQPGVESLAEQGPQP